MRCDAEGALLMAAVQLSVGRNAGSRVPFLTGDMLQ